jgi:hypothetical protein
MSRFAKAWMEQQQRRFLRPDGHRFVKRPDTRVAAKAGAWASVRKFDSLAYLTQPRVPKGNPEGGEWTADVAASGGAELPDITLAAMSQIAKCEAQWLADILICRITKSAACYNQAMVRLTFCEKGLVPPPLNF